MLSYLHISQFALIEDLEMHLGPGLTVLTGETGAGKSMILQAVSLLRGERASLDWIRQGQEEARVEAVFSPAPGSEVYKKLQENLRRAGLEPLDGNEGLSVTRTLHRRGRAYLGGQLVPVSVLAEVVGDLIDVSSQHEHQTLLRPARHLAVVDRCGVSAEARDAVKAAYEEYDAAASDWKTLQQEERQRGEREDFLRFQVQELEQAQLKMGEDELLRQERDRLRHMQKLRDAVEQAEHAITGTDPGLQAGAASVAALLADAARLDPALAASAQLARDAEIAWGEVAHALRRYRGQLHASPHRLQEIEDRLYALSKLLRKHGPSVEDALQKQQSLRQELDRLENHGSLREALENRLRHLQAVLCEKAERLSKERKQVAARLQQQVTDAIRSLAMPHASFEIALDRVTPAAASDAEALDRAPATAQGWDVCQFLLSPNPGEPLRPLQQIASGGELSRMLLALKQIVGREDEVATYIFDEVDTGIGGAVADTVGRNVHALSRSRQVLCITHLGPIAAYADTHFRVEKSVHDNRTMTSVVPLKQSQRVQEIARMIGGAASTAKSKSHAQELLALAAQAKKS